MTAWSCKTWKIFEQFLWFLEKRPLMVKFSKFSSENFHRLMDGIVVLTYRRIFQTGNRWNCALFTGQTKKQNFGSLSNYCADHAQSLPGPAPNIWLTMFQISFKSVHFRRSYSQTHEGHSLGPQSKSTIRPKAFGQLITWITENTMFGKTTTYFV